MPRAETYVFIERLVAWLAAGALWTSAVAWIAFQLQQDGIAPAVLFPLAVGAAVAAGSLAAARYARVASRAAILAAAVAWGLLVVVGQDYIGHRYHLRSLDDALARQDAPLAAAVAQEDSMRTTFVEFLAGRVRARPLWWGLDMVLSAIGAVLLTAVGVGRLGGA